MSLRIKAQKSTRICAGVEINCIKMMQFKIVFMASRTPLRGMHESRRTRLGGLWEQWRRRSLECSLSIDLHKYNGLTKILTAFISTNHLKETIQSEQTL